MKIILQIWTSTQELNQKINNIEAARSDLRTFLLSSLDNQENRTGRELINIFDNEQKRAPNS